LIHETNRSLASLDAAARKNKREDQLIQQHAIFAHELQIALKLMVLFLKP